MLRWAASAALDYGAALGFCAAVIVAVCAINRRRRQRAEIEYGGGGDIVHINGQRSWDR